MGFLTGNFERKVRFGLSGVFSLENPRDMYVGKSWLWKQAALFRGPQGTWRGPRFTGNFERQMKEGSVKGASLYGS